MAEIASLLFRRLRAPLMVLVLAYAVAMLGLVLIPGEDGQGQPWQMTFFHAFYVVTYTAPTIGYGEIPHDFTGAQRLWMMGAIYVLVIAWLYAIGTLLAVLQDPAFRRVVSVSFFRRSVRRLGEPFYIVCGHGENGQVLVRALTDEGIRPVVVDNDPERIETLKVEGLALEVPGLTADAEDPQTLATAGLYQANCAGLIALSRNDTTNLSVAVTSKLLAPQVPVFARARFRDTAANLASFGTEHILNPFDTFARRLATAVRSPSLYLLYTWLTGLQHQPMGRAVFPPGGTWILCGFGRFGRAVREALSQADIHTVVVEADPEGTRAPAGTVVGRGTEAGTLERAGIREATGIIAGTDSDANNLSILVTARELNPNLFTVGRQCRSFQRPTYEAAEADLIMDAGTIVTREVLSLITTPLLAEFLERTRELGENEGWTLIDRISAVNGERLPDTWVLSLEPQASPALADFFTHETPVPLRWLLTDPQDRDQWLDVVPLLLKRDGQAHLLPQLDDPVLADDCILFCGRKAAERPMDWIIADRNVLEYVCEGTVRPDGVVWQWLQERGSKAVTSAGGKGRDQ